MLMMPGSHARRMPGPRARRRGLGLFDAVLALGLFALFALGATALLESRNHARRASHAALQVTVLAEAARAHVESRFEAFRTEAGTGPVPLPLATLRAAGTLPDDFPGRDALGHDLVVCLRAAGADGLDLYVGERVRGGAATPPATALFQGRGVVRLGLLAPEAPGRLVGPALDTDVSAFAAGDCDGDLLRPGAIAALVRLDRESVLGPWLHRVAVPGAAEANRMETDLDMGGHDISGVGDLDAGSLAVTGDSNVTGTLTVDGELLIGQSVDIDGGAVIGGSVSTDSLTAQGVSAEHVTVRGTLTAGQVEGRSRIEADTAEVARLTVDSCTGC